MSLVHSPFNFVPLLGISPSEAHSLHFSPMMQRIIASASATLKHLEEDPFKM